MNSFPQPLAFHQCRLSIVEVGDGIDNDCEGNIDEEQRDAKDNDGDGLIDEDLALVNHDFVTAEDSFDNRMIHS